MSGTNISLVQRIRYLCCSKGITVATLEKELGLANSSIRKWDVNSPSIDRIIKVAEYFNISIDYLIGHESELIAEEISAEEQFIINTITTRLKGKELDQGRVTHLLQYIDFVFNDKTQ